MTKVYLPFMKLWAIGCVLGGMIFFTFVEQQLLYVFLCAMAGVFFTFFSDASIGLLKNSFQIAW
jgi:hypothetical protein